MLNSNIGFQFDFLSWQFSKIYRPKILLLLIFLAGVMSFCDRPNAEKKAQMLVLGSRGAEPWQYEYLIKDLNEAVELAPKLPETYAARANLLFKWSNFLRVAAIDRSKHEKAIEFGFDLKQEREYKDLALGDYKKSLGVLKERENTELEVEVSQAIDCLKKERIESSCYAHINFSQHR
ncbi:hypothetical protein [Myxosarcina sp. GI1]|uniref:hypothetical protein n=1 Tax=Myxosarcina sp. GI1 TaxID=1541065 RepID=UPI00056A4D38|nr:hypothetical protein [Myxosarcina sp. GI1]